MALNIQLGGRGKRRRSGGVTRRAKAGRGGRVAGYLFCGAFFLIGLVVLYFITIRPVWNMLDARGWPTVPAVVTASQLHVNHDSDGSTYRIDITFRYEVDGRSYSSDTYDFMSFFSSSGRSGKQAIVDAHPVGKSVTAYVDPADPTRAVLSRSPSHAMWFGLIPAVFVLIGLGGILGMIWSGHRKDWKTARAAMPGGDPDDDPSLDWLPKVARQALAPVGVGESSGGRHGFDAQTVSSGKSRWLKLLGIIAVAAFWNGITAIPVVSVLQGNADWFVGLFMIPFVLVGLGLLGGVGYAVLALGNPTVELTFEPRAVGRGQTMQLRWAIRGRAEKFDAFTVTVQGMERATYTRGTDTITDEHTFYEQVLHEADADAGPVAQDGEVQWTVPADTMHSFAAARNQIVWQVQVHGDVPRWPDVKDTHEFAVLPEGLAPQRRGMF
jgi:hypothetical protein